MVYSDGDQFSGPLTHLSEQRPLEADPLLAFLIIKTVMGSPGTVSLIIAAHTVLTQVRERLPKKLKAIVPDLCKRCFQNIALNRMRTALNIKTSPDIPVRHNARRINACIAQEIPVPHLVLISQESMSISSNMR